MNRIANESPATEMRINSITLGDNILYKYLTRAEKISYFVKLSKISKLYFLVFNSYTCSHQNWFHGIDFDLGIWHRSNFGLCIWHRTYHPSSVPLECHLWLNRKGKKRLIEEKTKFFPLMIKYFLITGDMIKARFFYDEIHRYLKK